MLITQSSDERLYELEYHTYCGRRGVSWPEGWNLATDSLRAALARAEKAERELEDEKQKVKNLEEYMLKGVAFRDELQAQPCRAKEAMNLPPSWHSCFHHPHLGCSVCEIKRRAENAAPCPHEAEAKRLREAGEGVARIAAERARQKAVEGWTPEHDAQHSLGELPVVAACYALEDVVEFLDDVWPATWDRRWDKRKKHNRVRRLEIAGALIAAELDRTMAELRCRAGEG